MDVTARLLQDLRALQADSTLPPEEKVACLVAASRSYLKRPADVVCGDDNDDDDDDDDEHRDGANCGKRSGKRRKGNYDGVKFDARAEEDAWVLEKWRRSRRNGTSGHLGYGAFSLFTRACKHIDMLKRDPFSSIARRYYTTQFYYTYSESLTAKI
ncbi:hypothetical protein HK104_006987 [Borealophlyctis nickersoniae]|nr:hypothetical protein HK104_006987 [Borealophlyctis nickersoniae]